MNQETELQRLEQIVEKLLSSFADLRAENAKLQQELSEKNKQLTELSNNLTTQESERGEIGKRVSRLVEQIEDWEKSLEDRVDTVTDADVNEAADSSEELVEEEEEPEPADAVADAEKAAIFTELDTETREEKKLEEEGRHQHNLFSLSGFQR